MTSLLSAVTNGPSKRSARRRLVVDPRVVVGIVLVVGSIAGTVAVVTADDRSVALYVAAGPISRGELVTTEMLRRIDTGVGAEGEAYLAVGALPAEGAVAARTIGAGEFVPLAALGDAASLDATTVVVEVAAPVAEAIGPGRIVELWSTAYSLDRSAAEPVVLVDDAEVVGVREGDGLLSRSSTVSVEVLIARAALGPVLRARADGAALSLVPADLPVRIDAVAHDVDDAR